MDFGIKLTHTREGLSLSFWSGEHENWIFYKLGRGRFKPSLIDLVSYEKSLLYAVQYDMELTPVRPIPNIGLSWNESELEAMRINREKAKELRVKYSKEKPHG